MIVAAELAPGGDRHASFDWRERRGLRVYRHGLEHDALLRPLGNVVYLMPPYVITPEQIDALVATARDGILAATSDCTATSRASAAQATTTSPTPSASTTGLEF
jgi:adenosylmethionine-8-amino-7-oxononanoate aminotransferase